LHYTYIYTTTENIYAYFEDCTRLRLLKQLSVFSQRFVNQFPATAPYSQ